MQAGALSLLLGAGFVAIAAALAPAVLRVRGPLAYVVAAGVVAAADVVLVLTAVSLRDKFTEGFVIAGHALVAAGIVAAWLLTGRPRPPLPPRPTRTWVRGAVRAEPLLAALAALMGLALLVQLFQGLTVVSNSWDAMTYHLPRAAHWVQQNAVAYYEGGNRRGLGYPPNGEMLHAWTMKLLGSDRIVNLVQWLALVGSGMGVALGARILRFGRPASLLAALLFMAMPIPILQSATALNDMILTFFVVAGTVFGVRGLRDGHLGEATVGAIAIALALGTKGIVLVAGPSLALIAGAVIWKSPAARRILPAAAAVFVVSVGLFSAYWFVLNVQETGDLYGDARTGIGRTTSLIENHARVYWSFAEAPGMDVPWVQKLVDHGVGAVLGRRENETFALDVVPHESTSAFGLIGVLVLLPIVLLTAFRRRSPPDRRILAIAVLLFFLIFPESAGDDTSLARLAVAGIALGAPLLAVLHRRRGLALAAVALSAVALFASVLDSPMRPIVVPRDSEPAYARDRMQQFQINRPDLGEPFPLIDSMIAPDARIAFVGGPHGGYEYPFFGRYLGRRITRMQSTRRLTLAEMRRNGWSAAIIDGEEGATPPPGLRAIGVAPRWWVVLPEPAPRVTRDDDG